MTKLEIADRFITIMEEIGERKDSYRAGFVVNPMPYSDSMFNRKISLLVGELIAISIFYSEDAYEVIEDNFNLEHSLTFRTVRPASDMECTFLSFPFKEIHICYNTYPAGVNRRIREYRIKLAFGRVWTDIYGKIIDPKELAGILKFSDENTNGRLTKILEEYDG